MISARENLSIRRRKISIFLFTFGAALGMVLIGASVYADFESTLFDATTIVDSAVRPINCPVLLSTSEKGKVSAVIRNSTDVRRELVVRAHITRGHLILIRELEDRITLDPGESLRFKWEVTPQDAAYGHLILAKVIVLNEGPQGTHKGSCGIIVLNLPDHVRGGQLFWLLYSLSSIGVLGGMTIWRNHGRSSAG
ncbi:MAG: hypothetical protein GWN62_20155, partial [Aliifodinibius sp.]|nr:hypothetical protein [Fodinibius sp.]